MVRPHIARIRLLNAKQKAVEESNERAKRTGKPCGYRWDLVERIMELERG